jgi:hypothetical protein
MSRELRTPTGVHKISEVSTTCSTTSVIQQLSFNIVKNKIRLPWGIQHSKHNSLASLRYEDVGTVQKKDLFPGYKVGAKTSSPKKDIL